jgi:transcriptional regulator with XRE-family HTH domain
MAGEKTRSFDGDAFYSALASTVVARDVSWKQVSQETGVSATTLTRMAQGRRPDASSLAALSAWAGINPADFVTRKARSAAEPLAEISSLLRSDPRLGPDAAVALEAMLHTAYQRLRSNPRTMERTEKRSKRRR